MNQRRCQEWKRWEWNLGAVKNEWFIESFRWMVSQHRMGMISYCMVKEILKMRSEQPWMCPRYADDGLSCLPSWLMQRTWNRELGQARGISGWHDETRNRFVDYNLIGTNTSFLVTSRVTWNRNKSWPCLEIVAFMSFVVFHAIWNSVWKFVFVCFLSVSTQWI